MRNLALAMVAIFAMALLVACGAKEGSSGDAKKKEGDAKKEGSGAKESVEPPAPKDGADSPEKAFEGIKSAMKGGKLSGDMLKWVVPEDRGYIVFGMYFAGALGAVMDKELKAEFEKINKKHNIPEKPEDGEELKMEEMADKNKVREYAAKVFKGVDLGALLEDVLVVMQKTSDKPPESEKEPTGIKDVKIDGDNATGTLTHEDGTTEDMKFKKVEGRWYVVFE